MKRSHAARSMYFWSWWIAFASIACLVNPQAMLEPLGVSSNADTLARMIGVMLGALAIYYRVMASDEAFRPLWRATAYVRLGVFPLSLVFVAINWINPLAVVVFAMDAVGGLWTAIALRRRGD